MPVSQGYFFMSTFKKFFSLYLNILNMIYNSFLHVIRALNVITCYLQSWSDSAVKEFMDTDGDSGFSSSLIPVTR